MDFFTYIIQERTQIISLLIEHINLTLISVFVAILIGVPTGILISHFKRINKTVMGIANTIQAIPSMALLGFLIPFLGIGVMPSIFMVVLYSLLPIIKNTYTSVEGINPQMIEAAEGMGLTKLQVLFKIQIPMALPIIMAGVRISAVTAVGLMTIAAFVGAGGLGYLVFSGIRTANSYQILAGAIPACLLALFIDWTAAIIEKIVVPKGIVSGEEESKKIPFFHKLILTLALFLVLFSSGKNIIKNFIAPQEKVVTIASKDFTEQIILGNMISELIEDKTDIKVNRKFSLGGTQVIFSAINSGEVDMYLDYTGTLLMDILKHDPISENIASDDVYGITKNEVENKYELYVGTEYDFNNTFALALRKDTVEKYNLKTISDLEKVSSQLILSPTFEFVNRDDGYVGLLKNYKSLVFKNIISMDGALRYQALDSKKSDVINAFSTDGLIATYDLVLLEDDKKFFPPYHAVPLIRREIIEKYPELKNIVNSLADILTDEVMRELNNQVDTYKREPQEVAHKFLLEKSLISE